MSRPPANAKREQPALSDALAPGALWTQSTVTAVDTLNETATLWADAMTAWFNAWTNLAIEGPMRVMIEAGAEFARLGPDIVSETCMQHLRKAGVTQPLLNDA